MEYEKPWLSVDQQIDRLESRGLDVGDRDHAAKVLRAIGYYRLTGYLYPFRESEQYQDEEGQTRVRVLEDYRAGATLCHGEQLIDFDRLLRIRVLDGIERFEIAVRMQMGHVLGRNSAFAYEDVASFTESFTAESTDIRDPRPSKHVDWLAKVNARRAGSDEQFVTHFRDKYDDRMPVWALTELLELGQLSTLYRGLVQQSAEEIANAFGVPNKKIFASWLASLNYVRNVAAHHARLYNRNLQMAPRRPTLGDIPELDHLRDDERSKEAFGTYNALAVLAYLVRQIDPTCDWPLGMANHLRAFPASFALSVDCMGTPRDWDAQAVWRS